MGTSVIEKCHFAELITVGVSSKMKAILFHRPRHCCAMQATCHCQIIASDQVLVPSNACKQWRTRWLRHDSRSCSLQRAAQSGAPNPYHRGDLRFIEFEYYRSYDPVRQYQLVDEMLTRIAGESEWQTWTPLAQGAPPDRAQWE